MDNSESPHERRLTIEGCIAHLSPKDKQQVLSSLAEYLEMMFLMQSPNLEEERQVATRIKAINSLEFAKNVFRNNREHDAFLHICALLGVNSDGEIVTHERWQYIEDHQRPFTPVSRLWTHISTLEKQAREQMAQKNTDNLSNTQHTLLEKIWNLFVRKKNDN